MSIPGPRTKALAARLRAGESRNVTFLGDDFPVFWESARGATVVDVDGNRYIDCTAAFGVANVGHANPRVTSAVARQAQLLAHGMGDVHPHELRVRLFERLAEVLPRGLTRIFLATTGSEAVEAALKTAMLYTGRSHFASFHGAYHGLSLGALTVGGIERFREPFAGALRNEPLLLAYPREGDDPDAAARHAGAAMLAHDDIAALIVEPIQGRAGCVVPPAGYLRALRDFCTRRGIVMIADEIFTGFGRTGTWFAVDAEDAVPDLICIGKAMGGGFPISALAGRAEIMDAWPASTGEALHTSTYLGNPVGCAAALAAIDELARRRLPERAKRLGETVAACAAALRTLPAVLEVRGRGLLWGVAVRDAACASAIVTRSLREGVMFLQSGIAGSVVSITPPLTITEPALIRALHVLKGAAAKTA